MKITSIILAFVSVLFVTNTKVESSVPVLENTLIGVYDGHEDYGYNFIITDEEGDERMITFQNVSESVSKAFDLASESLIGKKFEVTYISEMDMVKDEDGYEEEVEILTITALTAK